MHQVISTIACKRMHQVISLALPPRIRQALAQAGYSLVDDLRRADATELCEAAGISMEEAAEVLRQANARVVQDWQHAGGMSAADLYAKQASLTKVVTFCYDLDNILGGGIWPGQVTELCGMPGIGKTQLGIQLAIDAQIPAAFGGAEGEAVYIDTEGSFMVERVTDMAAAAERHVRLAAQRGQDAAQADAAQRFTLRSILAGIKYFRIHDLAEQMAVIKLLPELVRQNPKIKLVVVDSIAFHFRQEFKDMAARARVLTQLAQDLMALAEGQGVAVVLANQVTTRIIDGQQSQIVPALGDSWAHAASTRVFLAWNSDQQREAYLSKSPCMPPARAVYQVTPDGIRGMPREQQRAQH